MAPASAAKRKEAFWSCSCHLLCTGLASSTVGPWLVPWMLKLEPFINCQNVSQHVNENLMAVTPDSTASESEPSLMLPIHNKWLLKQPMNNRSHKLGNPPCQPCSKCLAAATRFGCGRWILLEMSSSQSFKCCWVWTFSVWDLSLAHYWEKSWQGFDMVGSLPDFIEVHSLGLLGSFLDYFADD